MLQLTLQQYAWYTQKFDKNNTYSVATKNLLDLLFTYEKNMNKK